MSKEGIDCFLLDCHTNDNVSEIEAAYGVKGFAVIVRLWQKIYSEHGYYCEWTDRSPLLFLSKWFGGGSGVDIGLINEVVGTALKNGLFNADLYEKYRILTSRGIQDRYFEVVKRRTSVKAINEYLLVSADKMQGNVDIFSISADRNEENVCRNAISKVKESKAKESKAKESKENKRQDMKGVVSNSAGRPALDYASLIAERGFSEALSKVLQEFVMYKKTEKRFEYKQIGFRNFLNEVQENVNQHGDAAVIKVIRETMSNGWSGVFFDRIEAGKNARSVHEQDQSRISRRISEVDNWLQ